MQRYEVLKCIGKGSFGTVYLSRSKDDGNLYVIKKIALAEMPEAEKEATHQEVRLLAQLKHPNIVSYKESFTHRWNNEEFLCIVMAYCDGGDLHDRIREEKTRGTLLSEAQILDWFVQILMALQYIHERKILHRDLKTKNIFLTKNQKVIKLGDFGIARVLNGSLEMAMTVIGTPYYMSPELCQNKPYSYKSDIWALGCILQELCSLKHAFDASSISGLVMKIMQGSIPAVPSTYTPSMRDLLKRMLSKHPESRPSVSTILSLPFIKARITELVLDWTNGPAAAAMVAAASDQSSVAMKVAAAKKRITSPPPPASGKAGERKPAPSPEPPDERKEKARLRQDEKIVDHARHTDQQNHKHKPSQSPPAASPPAAPIQPEPISRHYSKPEILVEQHAPPPVPRTRSEEEAGLRKSAVMELKEKKLREAMKREEELKAYVQHSAMERSQAKNLARKQLQESHLQPALPVSSPPPSVPRSSPSERAADVSPSKLRRPSASSGASSPSSSSGHTPNHQNPPPQQRVPFADRLRHNLRDQPEPEPARPSTTASGNPTEDTPIMSKFAPHNHNGHEVPWRFDAASDDDFGRNVGEEIDGGPSGEEVRWDDHAQRRKSNNAQGHGSGNESEGEKYEDDFEEYDPREDEKQEQDMKQVVNLFQQQLAAPDASKARPDTGLPSPTSPSPLAGGSKDLWNKRAAAIRQRCEKELGHQLFQQVYTYLKARMVEQRQMGVVSHSDDEESSLSQQLHALTGPGYEDACFLVDQLLFCEHTANGGW